MTKSTVVLVGDSIRMGYQDRVRQQLGQDIIVISPLENGGTSSNILARLDEWFIAYRPDVIHVNCGLHDIKCPLDTRTHETPFSLYEENLRTILKRLQSETKATVIFALTTPVNYLWHHAVKGFDRYEEDVRLINDIALRVTTELNIEVNDLYKVVMNTGRDEIMLPDGVHYSVTGYELLGDHVADTLRHHL